MMLDGPELPPILRGGVPFVQQARMLIPAVVCGLAMGTAIVPALEGDFSWRTVILLIVSVVAWFVAQHERNTYFAKRFAALEAVFDELARRYHANTRSD